MAVSVEFGLGLDWGRPTGLDFTDSPEFFVWIRIEDTRRLTELAIGHSFTTHNHSRRDLRPVIPCSVCRRVLPRWSRESNWVRSVFGVCRCGLRVMFVWSSIWICWAALSLSLLLFPSNGLTNSLRSCTNRTTQVFDDEGAAMQSGVCLFIMGVYRVMCMYR